MRDTRKECMLRGEHATRKCKRKEEGCNIDVGEAFDKPRRDVVTKRWSLRNGIVP